MNNRGLEQKNIYLLQNRQSQAERIEADISQASDRLNLPPFSFTRRFTELGFRNGLVTLKENPPVLIVIDPYIKWTEESPIGVPSEVAEEGRTPTERIVKLIRTPRELVSVPIAAASHVNYADINYRMPEILPYLAAAIDINDSNQAIDEWRRLLAGLK